MRHKIPALAMATAVAAAVTLTSAGEAQASGRACWTYENETTMSKLGVPLEDVKFAIEWCAVDGTITEFRVGQVYNVLRNSVWVRDATQPDIQQRNPLGQRQLYVYGDYSVAAFLDKINVNANGSYAKAGGEVKVGANTSLQRGRLGVHYEITVDGNGHLWGYRWK